MKGWFGLGQDRGLEGKKGRSSEKAEVGKKSIDVSCCSSSHVMGIPVPSVLQLSLSGLVQFYPEVVYGGAQICTPEASGKFLQFSSFYDLC